MNLLPHDGHKTGHQMPCWPRIGCLSSETSIEDVGMMMMMALQ